MSNSTYINPPLRLRWWLRPLVWIADRVAGRSLRMPRLLAWVPGLALASGFLEAAAAKPEGALTARLLKLVRLDVSLRCHCAFCFDMNAAEFQEAGISPAELEALREARNPAQVLTFSALERAALDYARALTATPIQVSPQHVAPLRQSCSEREFLLLAATIAQVNYWARFAQGLGLPGEGFAPECSLPAKPAQI